MKNFILLICLILISTKFLGCSNNEQNSKETQNDNKPLTPSEFPTKTKNNIIRTHNWEFVFNVDVNKVSTGVDIYFINSFFSPSSLFNRNPNAFVVGYISAGSSEDWRPDYDQLKKYNFQKYNGWKGEYYLDIKKWKEFIPVMHKRLEIAKSLGYDAVYFDNSSYWKKNGTVQDGIEYFTALAVYAHKIGLQVSLNGGYDISNKLADVYDFQVVENPQKYDELKYYSRMVELGKPVFNIVYESKWCKPVKGHSVQLYNLELSEKIKDCN